MRFYGVSKDDLNSLKDGLNILGRVMDVEEFHPYLYAMVGQGQALEGAKEAIEGDKPNQVAFAIPVSSDTLHFLLGSGIYLETEEFAYMAPNEGSRLADLDQRCKLFINEIQEMAIADDSAWVGEFLESHAPQEAAKPEVARTAPIEASAPAPDMSPGNLVPPAVKAPTSPSPQIQPVISSLKLAGVPGFERILIGDEPLDSLKVTQIIEIGDFVEDHQKGPGGYLHCEHEGREWLIYSDNPQLGQQNLARVIKTKYNLPDDPEISILSPVEVSEVVEGLVGEKI